MAAIAPAVAAAAAASGVATRPIANMQAYQQQLTRMFSAGGLVMQPVFAAARASRAQRVVYAEGEDIRVLRAAQFALEDGLAQPIIIGRPAVLEARLEKAGLRLRLGRDVEVVNPDEDSRFRQYWTAYHKIMGRRGISPEAAKGVVNRSPTTIAALMVRLGDADAMLCGLTGRFDAHLAHIQDIIGIREGERSLATVNALMMTQRTLFIADTYVNETPSSELLAHIALQAAREVRIFGLTPKVAFLSHSNYGSSRRESAARMREAYELFSKLAPDVESDGEMHGDTALSESIRKQNLMESRLTGEANILICPNLDAANILYNTLKVIGGDGITVGPILMGGAAPAHVMTPSSTVRRILNMTALVCAQASHALAQRSAA
jgi:malate dehydrogenase (oxaloacetate-decarboxylating)(NADP+)